MATTSCDGPRRPGVRAPGEGSPGSAALAPCDVRRGAHGCQGRCVLERCVATPKPRAHQPTQRVSPTSLGHTGGHDRPWHREAPPGHLRPRLATRARSFALTLSPTNVIATCDMLGVSSRRLEKLARVLGITKRRTSQSSHDGSQLGDAEVRAFRNRPPDSGPYPIVLGGCRGGHGARGWQDRERPRARVTGVSAEGRPERSFRVSVATSEDKAGWLALWRSLVARGLSEVVLVIVRCAPRPRRGHRAGPRWGHLATVSDPRPRGICSPRWPRLEQPSCGHPGAHHRRCAGSARGRASVPTGHLGAGWEAAPRLPDHLEHARCELGALAHVRTGTLAPALAHEPARSA